MKLLQYFDKFDLAKLQVSFAQIYQNSSYFQATRPSRYGVYDKFRLVREFESKNIFTKLVAAVYLYFFLEWLFFLTKPSFLSGVGGLEILSVFMVPSLIVSLVLALPIKILCFSATGRAVSRVLIAIILASLFFLLIDNFTYSIWSFGVFSMTPPSSLIYLVVFLLLLAKSYRFLFRDLRELGGVATTLIICLVFSSVLLLFLRTPKLSAVLDQVPKLIPRSQAYPNILLLAADGVPAENTSVYNADLQTTPNLNAFSKEMLVCENAFSTANRTGGAITSILTGRYPQQTKVLNYPDILQGQDSYHHILALLRQLGYQSMQMSALKFADSFDLNMRNGFDYSNFRNLAWFNLPIIGKYAELYNSKEYYFVLQSLERLVSRLMYSLGSSALSEDFILVTRGDVEGMRDRRMLDKVEEFIGQTRAPWFTHIHFMGTHGPRYYPRLRKFSVDKLQDADLMPEFFEDALLEFDSYFAEIVTLLRQSGKLDSTMIIVYSDHDQRKNIGIKVPLMFYFPGGEYTGTREGNVSIVDIAPTILDYLSIEKPEWMSGESVLREPPQNRLIFSAKDSFPVLAYKFRKPPFYNFHTVGVVQCDKFTTLELESNKIAEKSVSTLSCAQASQKAELLNILKEPFPEGV